MLDIQKSENRRKLYIQIAIKRCQPGSGSSLEFLKNRTWNHPVTNLTSLIQKTRFVVVGGIATRLYMPERMTDDFGILVLTNDAASLYQELRQAGSKKVGKLSIGGSTWLLPDNTLLDVIESESAWVNSAVTHPESSPDGLPIIALPYLVLMKLQASRSQDIADVTRMLGGADETALNLVRNAVKTYLNDAVEDLESLIMLGKLEFDQ